MHAQARPQNGVSFASLLERKLSFREITGQNQPQLRPFPAVKKTEKCRFLIKETVFLDLFANFFEEQSFFLKNSTIWKKTSIILALFYYFSDSLRRRANARNVSFGISLRWLIHIINSVDKTKLFWHNLAKKSGATSIICFFY